MQSAIASLEFVNSGIFGVDVDLRLVHWNAFMETNTGRSAEQVLGRNLFECFPELPRAWLVWKIKTVFTLGGSAFSSWRQRPYVFRFRHTRPLTGGIDCMRQDATFMPILAEGGVAAVLTVLSDATDTALAVEALEQVNVALKLEMAERKRMETELRIAQKLEAVGRLASGVAHEINTPVQFVGDSVGFLQDAYRDVRALVDAYHEAIRTIGPTGSVAQIAAWTESAEQNIDLAYLDANVPQAFVRTEDGIERVATLVRAMKDFGSPDQGTKSSLDLNKAVVTTLVIAGAEYRNVAAIVTELGDIPDVLCFGNEIKQVILNLVVNAAHAIADAGRAGVGEIRLRTWQDNGHVRLSVQDNGVGISDAIRERIFDLFFTTKEVGRGTGQGLAMVRSIVDKHGGTLSVDSEVGIGSTFEVRLPIS